MNIVEQQWQEFEKRCFSSLYSELGKFNLKCFYVKGFSECSLAFKLMEKEGYSQKRKVQTLNFWFDEVSIVIKNSDAGKSIDIEELQTSITPLENRFSKLTSNLSCSPVLIYELKRALLSGFQHCLCYIGNETVHKAPINKTVSTLDKDSIALLALLEKQAKGETAAEDATHREIH